MYFRMIRGRRIEDLSFFCFHGWRRAINLLDRGDEAIAPPGNRLDKTRIVSGVVQGLAKLVHRGIQAVVVIDESVRGPKPLAQFLTRHHFGGMLEKVQQDLQGLALKTGPAFSVLAQLSRAGIQLMRPEAKEAILAWRFRHFFDAPWEMSWLSAVMMTQSQGKGATN